MIVTITSKSTPKEIEAALKKLGKKKPVRRRGKVLDAYKHCGVIKLKEDPVEIQKKLRDEWG